MLSDVGGHHVPERTIVLGPERRRFDRVVLGVYPLRINVFCVGRGLPWALLVTSDRPGPGQQVEGLWFVLLGKIRRGRGGGVRARLVGWEGRCCWCISSRRCAYRSSRGRPVPSGFCGAIY